MKGRKRRRDENGGRDGGTEGRKDGGTEGRRDGGTEGRRDGGTRPTSHDNGSACLSMYGTGRRTITLVLPSYHPPRRRPSSPLHPPRNHLWCFACISPPFILLRWPTLIFDLTVHHSVKPSVTSSD
ncbi:hypothetical protein BV898_20027 [Hypsibius exemplaris]|uniref:Uncharacterized protein n=1 Tax=Hypsibius exemplaris TaxID=2072580 RepID=A0A9X6RPH4_HYPEX|nr:hypothetical protein BV898_20027 [Hypsibius exemplaris]